MSGPPRRVCPGAPCCRSFLHTDAPCIDARFTAQRPATALNGVGAGELAHLAGGGHGAGDLPELIEHVGGAAGINGVGGACEALWQSFDGFTDP